LLDETIVFLRGDIFKLIIYAECPLNVFISYPFLVDHILMVVSLDPVTILFPSVLNSKQVIKSPCPYKVN
jgi:hypothetical protein